MYVTCVVLKAERKSRGEFELRVRVESAAEAGWELPEGAKGRELVIKRPAITESERRPGSPILVNTSEEPFAAHRAYCEAAYLIAEEGKTEGVMCCYASPSAEAPTLRCDEAAVELSVGKATRVSNGYAIPFAAQFHRAMSEHEEVEIQVGDKEAVVPISIVCGNKAPAYSTQFDCEFGRVHHLNAPWGCIELRPQGGRIGGILLRKGRKQLVYGRYWTHIWGRKPDFFGIAASVTGPDGAEMWSQAEWVVAAVEEELLRVTSVPKVALKGWELSWSVQALEESIVRCRFSALYRGRPAEDVKPGEADEVEAGVTLTAAYNVPAPEMSFGVHLFGESPVRVLRRRGVISEWGWHVSESVFNPKIAAALVECPTLGWAVMMKAKGGLTAIEARDHAAAPQIEMHFERRKLKPGKMLSIEVEIGIGEEGKIGPGRAVVVSRVGRRRVEILSASSR